MTAVLPAAEQDNWYLADEWAVFSTNRYGPAQVFYESNGAINGDRIYVADNGASKVQVFETNGTKLFEITGLSYVKGVAVDDNGTIFCLFSSGLKSYEHNGTFKQTLGTNGSGDSQFNILSYNYSWDSGGALAIHPTNGRLYAVDGQNSRVQILDTNGSFHAKFGTSGTAPGQFDRPRSLAFLPDGRLLVTDKNYLHYYDDNGTFLNRVTASDTRAAAHKDGTIWTSDGRLRDTEGTIAQSGLPGGSGATFTPDGDLLVTTTGGTLQIWKRAYRTKGLVNHNVIPQPAIRSISQRSGSNVIDLDFEIIDPDDANATVGILAAVDGDFDDTSKWILPTAWVDGTGNKIGVPLATNQVHRVSWNVKGDWAEQTGTLKFEVLCRDARRVNSPVDLHFLALPLADGNMTISRSPLTDSDLETHFKYLIATGTDDAFLEDGQIKCAGIEGNATNPYVFTNAGAIGRNGPTWADVNASYTGTNLESNVSMATQGIQEWIVPTTGTYTIAALGAQGGDGYQDGHSGNKAGGLGARMKGEFQLTAGTVLKILVGQKGSEETSYSHRPGGGGGGTFVVKSDNTKLIIAGGGGGGGNPSYGQTDGAGGIVEETNANTGTAGNGGTGNSYSGGGAGFAGDGASIGNSLSFVNGAIGGYSTSWAVQSVGGFGGGGGAGLLPGGGGGYSGGNVTGSWSGSGSAYGGGSFNAGANQVNIAGVNEGHGKVFIILGTSVSFDSSSLTVMSSSRSATEAGRARFIQNLGYRWATSEEVNIAREAATPGSVNQWTATRQVKPRNLPGKVNEFGFDTERTPSDTARYWWVVKEQE